MSEVFKCIIKTLSPIHIGCDDAYEPASFVVDEDGHKLTVFEPESFYYQMEEKDRQSFLSIMEKGTVSSILELYKFMRGRKASGREVEACPGFISHYRETLALSTRDEAATRTALSDFAIRRTSYLVNDERPYLPGSSIKGSLRTAYLNMLAREKVKKPFRDSESGMLEEYLLDGGRFSTDPFRMLKISDFLPVGEAGTKVVYVINKKKRISKYDAGGPFQILEVIQPGALFIGSIFLGTSEKGSEIKKPIEKRNLFESISRFYGKEKEREDRELTDISVPGLDTADIEASFLMRVGQHSGAESITIEGYRQIKIMMGKGQQQRYEDKSTTLWLSSGHRDGASIKELMPLGWVTIEEVDREREREIDRVESMWREKREIEVSKQANKRKVAIALKREEEEKKRRNRDLMIQEEARREKEEERRRELIEAMSPEERDILLIEDPSTSPNDIYEIYKKLSSFSDENRIKVASALKSRWIKEGKWERRDCSEKQYDKVLQIEYILGEK